jgi:superfamily II DNA or RNA helicase
MMDNILYIPPFFYDCNNIDLIAYDYLAKYMVVVKEVEEEEEQEEEQEQTKINSNSINITTGELTLVEWISS